MGSTESVQQQRNVIIFPTDLILTGSGFHGVGAATEKGLVPARADEVALIRRRQFLIRSKQVFDMLKLLLQHLPPTLVLIFGTKTRLQLRE